MNHVLGLVRPIVDTPLDALHLTGLGAQDEGVESVWSDAGLQDAEALMLQVCAGDSFDRLTILTTEHLGTGGKRLRARLALGALEALGGKREVGIPWAAACELLHNATLVHDDVQDGDRVRRGETTMWVRHGVAQAINAGDLMLMLPYTTLDALQVSDGVKWALASALARNAERIVRGQANELDLLALERLDWGSYADATEGKTAALFGLPVQGAALLAGRSRADARDLAMPFRHAGVLFQVQDDVLDLYGDKGRGLVGSDLYEGKVSALVVEHLRLHPGDRSWILGILTAPREETNPRDVRTAIHRFRTDGALDAVWERLGHLQRQVHQSQVLCAEPRLHAIATALVRKALAPIHHTAPSHLRLHVSGS